MDSKLARKMAYKKKLEEEYRDFQERCKVDTQTHQKRMKIYIYSSKSINFKYEKKPGRYESRLCDDGQWSYQEISVRRRRDLRCQLLIE